jgi:hypothetical protein
MLHSVCALRFWFYDSILVLSDFECWCFFFFHKETWSQTLSLYNNSQTISICVERMSLQDDDGRLGLLWSEGSSSKVLQRQYRGRVSGQAWHMTWLLNTALCVQKRCPSPPQQLLLLSQENAIEVHGFLVFCKTWKIVHTGWTKTNFFTSNVVTDLNFKNHVNIHIKMGQSLPVWYICEDIPKCATCLQFKQMEEWNHKLWSMHYKGSQGVWLLRMQQWKPMVKERIKRSLLKVQSRNDPIST